MWVLIAIGWILATLITYIALEYIEPSDNIGDKVQGMAGLLIVWPVFIFVIIAEWLLKKFVGVGDWFVEKLNRLINK